jgi:diacylglycerol kinase (ATP)
VRTILIAANPKSGSKSRSELVDALQSALRREGFAVQVESSLDSLSEKIQSLYAEGGLETVIAAGGDGTVSAVATRTPASMPITVLPLGSENLLAKYYGFSASPTECVSRIVNRKTAQIDAMDVNGKLAMIMVSLGFDADVVRRVHVNRKSHITRWAYRMHALQSWLQYPWPTVRVRAFDRDDSPTVDTEGQWIFVFNIPRYATDLRIVKEADPSDGLLNVGLFRRSGRIKGLVQYLSVLRGTHFRRSDWQEFTAQRVEFHSQPAPSVGRAETGTEASVQYDGDWGGSTPLSIRLLPHRITLLTS